METIKKIGSITGKVTKGVGWISFVCVLAMMLVNVADVCMNKIFHNPILGTYEITQYLLLSSVFCAFAYAQTKKTHINMTIIIVHFPAKLRFIIFTLMNVLSVVISAMLCYAAFGYALSAMAINKVSEVLYFPIYPFYFIESLAMAVFTIALIYDTVLSALAIGKDECAQLVMKDWS